MHAAFASTAIIGAGRPTVHFNDVADMATDFFHVGYVEVMPVVESPVLQSTATIPRIWLGTPVRKHARAVKRTDQGSTLQRARTINKLAGSAMLQRRKARIAEEEPVFVCRTPAKLIKLTGPPPLNHKRMVEEEEVSEEMKEAFAVWMKQRMKPSAKKAGY
ncbi:hypothetical protein AX15_006179 [Amanita polypyramis BW_CC]|nr:hypothetical protein AX15_006179 [Amanita polypyramis BW_CC]